MSFGFGLCLPSLNYVASLFSPLSLFANGEQGAWYDPSDLTTLFQDSAGTTPVTAVEQPVGLMLDKSQGLVLGSELVTNGGGSSLTGWTSVGAAIFTVDANRFKGTVTGNPSTSGGIRQDITVVAGKSYKVSIDIDLTVVGTGRAQLIVYDGAAFTPEILNVQKTVASSYVISGYVRPTGTTIRVYLVVAADSLTTTTAYFDNISVRELPGNHAFQSTSASRPVLSARYNLLTKTEQFDDAAWSRAGIVAFGSGSIANAITAPDGTLTADFIVEDTSTGQHIIYNTTNLAIPANVAHTISGKAKIGTRSYICLQVNAVGTSSGASVVFNLSNGTATQINATADYTVSNVVISPDSNGFYSFAFTFIGTGVTLSACWCLSNSATPALTGNKRPTYTGDGTSGIYIWGIQLIVTNDGVGLPAYQRVNTSTDYDTAGFPLYLKTDGVDDWMQTNSINFTSTDKMTVWAGLRNLSNTGSIFAELSASVATLAGSFYVVSGADLGVTGYSSIARGTAAAEPGQGSKAFTFNAPDTAVLSITHDIAADLSTIRRNTVAGTDGVGDKGTGNFGTYPLYLFRRGGTTAPFNGRMYGLIVRGAQSTASQITSGETYMNQKSKAY